MADSPRPDSDLQHLEHELFLLMIHLSQREDEAEIKRNFLEALNTIWEGVEFTEYSDPSGADWKGEAGEEAEKCLYEISTKTHHFGYVLCRESVSRLGENERALLRNAVKMAAIILENRRNREERELEVIRTEKLRSAANFKKTLENIRLYAVMLDTEGRISFCNRYLSEKTGWKQKEIIGKNWFDLFIPREVREDFRENVFLSAVSEEKFSNSYENRIVTKDGDYRDVLWSNACIYEGSRVAGVTSIGQDITERKHYEKELNRELHEKRILLKEIHHRVKNNLNVVVSLLELQKGEIDSIEKAQEAFMESSRRIHSMALVHESLYHSSSLSDIDIHTYIESMVEYLKISLSMGSPITYDVNVENIRFDITKAIPCGIIINELITNAVKHAFKERGHGNIQIQVKTVEKNSVEVSVGDNGTGFPEGFAVEKASGLGMNLVKILSEQIDGKLHIDNRGGARVSVVFPLDSDGDSADTAADTGIEVQR